VDGVDGLAAGAVWLALHFGIGFSGTWMARRYALRRNLLDQPGERRSHVVATPRGGGIAIVASWLVALAIIAAQAPELVAPLAATAAGLLLVAAIGWVDDHRPLSPWWRLGVHALAAGLLAWAVLAVGGSAVQAAVAFLAALVLVNVWNFMDGIDGLAASQALLVAIGYAALTGAGVVVWLALALAAGIAGFLPFNLPLARIFLGDVGSGALGYAIAVLLAATWLQTGHGISPWLLLLPVSVFLVDASLTLAGRMLRRERWWEPHVQHAYQSWARGIGRHGPVTLAYALATAGLVTAMLILRSFPAPVTIGMIATAWLAGGAIWVWLQRRYRVQNP
jgi:UDP-N-acetylmuramyl pentapeptide phosphotransferase/UDP-N-acetylglucosamine-1-phosphate transferase